MPVMARRNPRISRGNEVAYHQDFRISRNGMNGTEMSGGKRGKSRGCGGRVPFLGNSGKPWSAEHARGAGTPPANVSAAAISLALFKISLTKY